jgi:hypothetical protein
MLRRPMVPAFAGMTKFGVPLDWRWIDARPDRRLRVLRMIAITLSPASRPASAAALG